MMKGCDFSHWNSPIIWDRYKSLDFVILKATEGLKIKDSTYKKRLADLKFSRPVGVYHFLSHNKKGQASFFYNYIKKDFLSYYNARTKVCTYYPIVDVEADCTLSDLLQFCEEWQKISNIPLVVYTSVSWVKSWQKNKQAYTKLLGYRVKFWLAGWTNDIKTIQKRMTEDVVLYQFTDKYNALNLDCNYFNDSIYSWGYNFTGSTWQFRRK